MDDCTLSVCSARIPRSAMIASDRHTQPSGSSTTAPLDAERARRRSVGRLTTCEVFQDGSAALERLAPEPAPDVLVLDWVMPGVSGIEVCRFLRSRAAASSQHSPILLLTAHTRHRADRRGPVGRRQRLPRQALRRRGAAARVGALLRTRELLERAEQAEARVRTAACSRPRPTR